MADDVQVELPCGQSLSMRPTAHTLSSTWTIKEFALVLDTYISDTNSLVAELEHKTATIPLYGQRGKDFPTEKEMKEEISVVG